MFLEGGFRIDLHSLLPFGDRVDRAVKRLQVYVVDRSLRGLAVDVVRPDWAMERHRALTQASVGRQSRSSTSLRGIPSAIQPGVGKSEHLRLAANLESPFTADPPMDDDLLFGCLLYTSPSPRDQRGSRMPSSA